MGERPPAASSTPPARASAVCCARPGEHGGDPRFWPAGGFSSFWLWITTQITRIIGAVQTFFAGTMSNKAPPDEKLLELNLHSHFIIGSVSEDNSEDETSSLVKIDLLEEKDQSISPVSISSDSLSDLSSSGAQEALHMR
uniref:Uncharacterized protein n=1 Tax=Naja naja TaxID=35670 RepID=A0A8C6YC14_NAJNA